MRQIRLKIGDLFSVTVGGSGKRFFQYVANDTTQLNSSVIRVFEGLYRSDEIFDLKDIVTKKVDFHAHVFLRNGIKLGFWEKIGNIAEIGKTKVLFRCTNDIGNPKVTLSERWFVWKINEPTIQIGPLTDEYRRAELGLVFSPVDIIRRIKTGGYGYNYPE